MEIRKIDGKTYVVFSADEAKARIEFEKAMTSEDTLEKMVEALLKASVTLD